MPHVVDPVHRQPRSRGAHGRALHDARRDHRRPARRRRRARSSRSAARACSPIRRRTSPSPTARPTAPSCYLNVRIAAGRERALVDATGEALIAAVRAHFAAIFASRPVGITLQIDEGAAGVRRQAQQPASALRGQLSMLDDATIAALAAELHDAQRRRVQVRHFSQRHPGMTIDDGYAIQRAWLKTQAGRRARRQGPQDRPDLAGDAAGVADRRARLRAAARRHVLRGRRRHPVRSLHRAARRGRARVRPRRGRCSGPGVTLADVLAATELRDAGGRDHRRAHRAVRPRDQGAAQGVRHHRRLRRQRRHRHRRPAGARRTTSTCAGSARCSTRTASSRRPAWPPACSIIRATASSGSPTRSPPYDEQLNAGDVVLGGSFTRPTTGRARRRLSRRLRAARRDRVQLRLNECSRSRA